MASNPATELASLIQVGHIESHPDPAHDVNPSTAASTKVPATVESPEHSPTRSQASDIPSDIIRPRRRARSFPPLPDLRFEQSYLASIAGAESGWKVAYITFRDQVLLPLTQGVLWNLLIFGWRHWNRGAKFAGRGVGARIRRWWWEVNNWKVPENGKGRMEVARVEDFYVGQAGTSMGD